jgi:hypothetical protein
MSKPGRVLIVKANVPKEPHEMVSRFIVDPQQHVKFLVARLQMALIGRPVVCNCYSTERLIADLKQLGVEISIEGTSNEQSN